MNTIDFFVHPEFPCERNKDNSWVYNQYHEAVIKRAREVRLPIHVARDESSDETIRKIIPAKRRIIAYDDNHEALTDEFDKLEALCKEGDIYVFHGTYYLECVITFIGQVYALMEHGFRWSRRDLESGGKDKLTEWIHTRKELAESGKYHIGLCYCFDRRTKEMIERNDPSWQEWQTKYPHDSIPF